MKPLFFVSFLTLLFFQTAQASDDMERGLVVTNPLYLRALENNGFSINQVLDLGSKENIISNESLFQYPQLKIVKKTIEEDIAEIKAKDHEAGVGTHHAKRLFDLSNLSSGYARFVLVGVVNRQDKAFLTPDNCGEVRLIYRLAYSVKVDSEEVSSRLPMTINLIFHAKNKDEAISCQEIAKRWQEMYALEDINHVSDSDKIQRSIKSLLNSPSFLSRERFSKSHLKSLEINLQAVRTPAVVRPDFGANSLYLLRHFKWNESSNAFEVHYLENQIDKDKISRDPALLAKLLQLIKANVKSINDGTYIFPDEFLTKKALSLSPAGLKRLENRPFTNLVTKDAILAMNIDWKNLDRIMSDSGLLRRLNDMSCTGCHQTKSVAGFHFSGKDPQGRYPGNSAFMPGSPHFYGDLPRRRTILSGIEQAKIVNYARGFAEHPDDAAALVRLKGSGLLNGWGSHCAISDDPTFKKWTCGEGLRCTPLLTSDYDSHIGICLSNNDQEVGQPCETGHISYANPNNGVYVKVSSLKLQDKVHFACNQQSSAPGASTGGFPGGSIRRTSCKDMTSVEACGVLPGGKEGFNACIASSRNFLKCVREYKADVGLRACGQDRPCRDDYICAESNTPGIGACLPPYFLFQFRVDGHPI